MIMTSLISTSSFGQLENIHSYSDQNPSNFNTKFDDTFAQNLLLLSFDVETSQRHALIQWSTFLEFDYSVFTIERSTDRVHWEDIYQTESGANYIMGQCLYSWIDDNPCISISYYRLKIVDVNSNIEYSLVKSFNFNDIVDLSQLLVYPNSTNGNLTIEGSTNDLDKLIILDASGVDVISNVNIVLANSNSINLDVSALPSGHYFIKTPTNLVKVSKL
jgi:hypothetical protein